MRLKEFAIQSQTPEQLRLTGLKNIKDQAAKNLAAERKRQQVAKTQAKLNDLKNQVPVPSSTPKL
jgi:hypothetical protein